MNNLYIIKCGDWYKIGTAVDVAARLRGLQIGNPVELTLYKSYPVERSFAIEQVLHKTFSSKRGIGEWFKLSEDDLEHIDKFCNAPFGLKDSAVPYRQDAKYTSAAKMHRYYAGL